LDTQLPVIKTCFKCLRELPLTEFYKHPMMGDGHLGKCKTCTKDDVMRHRTNNIEKFRAYDRARGNRQSAEDVKRYRKNNPEKYKAHRAVAYAVRAGTLIPMSCKVCGQVDGVHAHHEDYSKPLDVQWLCPEHHHAAHKKVA